MVFPQGYHITFGGYGDRLPGSSKPHVDRDHNEYGTPFAPTDPQREADARRRMKYEPVRLTLDQRRLVEGAIAGLCTRYNWQVHAIAVQSDHVHVVLSADREGKPLREAIKASASRALNDTYGRRKWWASNGSAKYLWETDYFRAAVRYVKRQRDY